MTYISICNILKKSIDERLTKNVIESSIPVSAVASDNQQQKNSDLKTAEILNDEIYHKSEPLQKKISRGINSNSNLFSLYFKKIKNKSYCNN